MVGGIVVILIGLVVVHGAGSELLDWLRSRRRLVRTRAVVVGHADPGAAVSPGIVARSAEVEFSTESGERIRTVSSAWSYPGPRVGRQINIRYDPRNPRRSAERSGVIVIKLLLMPPLLVFGGWLIAYGITSVTS
ncbi:MAG TPA: DUF3592 domain-containing protein [Mycobacteriales bacterium]|nr:DUF3592 domain-containing protein [Mycobacteriales bacterium]